MAERESERRPLLPRMLRPDTFDAERVERIWQSVESARGAQVGSSGSRDRSWTAARGWRLPLVLAGTLATAAVLATLISSRDLGLLGSSASSAPASALTRSDGRALARIEARAEAPVHVVLSDGSAFEVSPGGVLAPVEQSKQHVVFRLARGAARFAVKPGGPRRWAIEAGPARIEVIGTRFEIVRERGGTRVRVTEGKVRVLGASLPGGEVQLTAGGEAHVGGSPEMVEMASKARGVAPSPTIANPTLAVRSVPAVPAVPLLPSSAVARPVQASASAAHAYARAPHAPSGVEALLAEADRARMAKQPAAAAVFLERAVREHPGDPRAGLAAFTLGVLREQAFGDARGAAEAYTRALALGLSGALRQDARVRLAQAKAQAQVRAEAAAGAPP